MAPVPAGLSDKELARLRAETLRSPQLDYLGVSTSNLSQSMSSPNAIAESGEAVSPYDVRRLHSEVESLLRATPYRGIGNCGIAELYGGRWMIVYGFYWFFILWNKITAPLLSSRTPFIFCRDTPVALLL